LYATKGASNAEFSQVGNLRAHFIARAPLPPENCKMSIKERKVLNQNFDPMLNPGMALARLCFNW